MAFYPGPGLGGHCIPIDPFYLTWKAREFDITTRFIELAGQINAAMPKMVVQRVSAALDERFKRGINGAKILIVGLAYKKNIDDIRESPSLKLIELFEERGGVTDYLDPFVPVVPPTREHGKLSGRESIVLSEDALQQYDAVVIATDHDGIDYNMLVRSSRLVIDTRNVLARAGITDPRVVKA